MSDPKVPKTPEILDKIVDLVLAHRYKPKRKTGGRASEKRSKTSKPEEPGFPSGSESAKIRKANGSRR